LNPPALISPLRALTAQRLVLWSILCGVSAWLVLALTTNPLLPLARILIAWDVGVAVYVACAFWLLHDATPEHMAHHAQRHQTGRHAVLSISLLAVIVSLAVIAFEIRAINAEPDALQNMRVAFVLVTVALSWLFVHTSFAAHYAFEYYGAHGDAHGYRGGLIFPGGEDPDFLDIWHFSVVIGLALATADINISSKSMRRIATVHGVGSFLFNTVILAATINFASALFQPPAR
jgi:uncharacterized membrane protein